MTVFELKSLRETISATLDELNGRVGPTDDIELLMTNVYADGLRMIKAIDDHLADKAELNVDRFEKFHS